MQNQTLQRHAVPTLERGDDPKQLSHRDHRDHRAHREKLFSLCALCVLCG